MTTSAAHAAAFFRELEKGGKVWTIRDKTGFPAPEGDGGRAMPFWSSRSRAELITVTVAAYAGFKPEEIGLRPFRERWLPGLARDGLKIGINWSGSRATGYDMSPSEVEARLLTLVRADAP